ncbi:uncharacterized protein SCODWIG_02620 [Saccharomycodes ludwigii]|uniref:Protein-lysine N-methyltransferase EFM6 n=1 Tax=Saccharomycodes ludwigii TaxID=36035 RepID=A0A376B8H4_9ASCO|nr:hypothetical protein SCDLUD_002759 [Saccharomycodes ludwigii]KAH3901270.1 hypothetical protein SCDLUD_002759 [Saccharomycodes ludwigii]SSD60859.1 uncharacterized protein SCODWIG_02620 [Saccharomycodes ludwigii]
MEKDTEADSFFANFLDIVPSRKIEHLGTTGLEFNGQLSPELKIYEDGGGLGCGGKIWIAGELLCEYIMEHKVNFNVYDKVIELGSGTGIVGLLLGLMNNQGLWINDKYKEEQNSKKVYVTDITELVPLMDKNVNLNNVGNVVEAASLEWGEPVEAKFSAGLDLVLAADCVYLEKAFPLLEKTLLDLTSVDKPPMILMSYRKRRKADKHFFIKIKKNFKVIEIKDFKNFAQYLKQRTHLFQLIRLNR